MTRICVLALLAFVAACAVAVPGRPVAVPGLSAQPPQDGLSDEQWQQANDLILDDGTYIVGVDIKPGTYRSEGAAEYGCRWTAHDGPSANSSLTAYGYAGPGELQIVELGPTDKAFYTYGCLPWEKIK